MNHFYSLNFVGWPPVPVREIADPNSRHWEAQAQLTQRRLADQLGHDDYCLWAEITWPGETIDGQSWKQIHDTCQWALDHQDATYQTLECTCRPNATVATCLVCLANARIRERDEH